MFVVSFRMPQCQTVIYDYTAPKSLTNRSYMPCICCIALLIQKDTTLLVSLDVVFFPVGIVHILWGGVIQQEQSNFLGFNKA